MKRLAILLLAILALSACGQSADNINPGIQVNAGDDVKVTKVEYQRNEADGLITMELEWAGE